MPSWPRKRTGVDFLPHAVQRLVFCVFTGSAAFAGPEKLAGDLDRSNPQQRVEVIVQYKQRAAVERNVRSMQSRGALLKAEMSFINAAAYSLPAAALQQLADDPEVKYVTPDRQVHSSLEFANPAVGADLARKAGVNGYGITVAVIDSGISNHSDLKGATESSSGSSRVVYSKSFLANDSTTEDAYGHGTPVAGIIAGNASRSSGSSARQSFYGISTAANLVNLRVLDSAGTGSDSAVINAIHFAIKNKARYNIRVINLSLGRPVYESYKLDPLCQAVEAAWENGIVVVVAAGNRGRGDVSGNQGYGSINSPANDPLVITVGAMNDKLTASRADDVMASYSSKGPSPLDHIVKPDLIAPGNRIVSLMPPECVTKTKSTDANFVPLSYYLDSKDSKASSDYYKLSGTSMAAPMVSGAVALLLDSDGSLTPDQVKARLMRTAAKSFPAGSTITDPVSGATYQVQYDLFTVGAGYLDIWAALHDNTPLSGTAASPTAHYDVNTNQVFVRNTEGFSAVWGSEAAWSSSAVWGNMAWVDGASAVWGDSAVWGSSATVSGDSFHQLMTGDN